MESVEDDDLSTSPQAVGNAVPYYTAWNDVHQIYYRSYDGHIHEIRWQGQQAASNWDVIQATPGAPPAASDPAAFYSPDTNTKHIFYRSADGHLHEIWWGNSTTHIDITREARVLPPLSIRQLRSQSKGQTSIMSSTAELMARFMRSAGLRMIR